VKYVQRIARMTRLRRRERAEVQTELLNWFRTELQPCVSDEERLGKAKQLIAERGRDEYLARSYRRAKKKCRPWWRKTIGLVNTTLFSLAALYGLYAAWFAQGKPVITGEYLERLNQINRPPYPSKNNAWPYYERACSLYEKPIAISVIESHLQTYGPNTKALTDQEWGAIKNWIERNNSAWLELEAASDQAHCYREFPGFCISDKSKTPLLISHKLSLLGTLRELMQLGLWKSRWASRAGDFEASIRPCLVIVQLGGHLQQCPWIIEQLVGQAAAVKAHHEILHLLMRRTVSKNQLHTLQSRLSMLYAEGYPFINAESGRLMMLDAVQQCFTKGGPGGGHLIPGNLIGAVRYETKEYRPVLEKLILYPVDIAVSIFHARRNRIVNKINWLCDEMQRRARLSPFQRRRDHIDKMFDFPGRFSNYRYGLVYLLQPNEPRASEVAFRGKVTYEAVLTVLALKRYRLDRGTYPESLEILLSEGYMTALPMDPFSDKQLIYKPTHDDFLLYSVGENFVDDGGKRHYKEGQVKLWSSQGDCDAVFWPFE
jgi:hypothetical protein